MGENSGLAGTKRKMKTSDFILAATGTALIAVCSFIAIPMTIPFTLQTFAVFFVLLMLGGKRGVLSILVYVIMGAVGLPVFSGFTGGAGVLFGKTGGYIIGFIFMGLIYAVLTKVFGNKLRVQIAALLTGLFVCYAFGTMWFYVLFMRETGVSGIITVLSLCVFPFIIPDMVKMGLAVLLSGRVRSIIRQDISGFR